jgi:hypothetical protein
MKILLTAIMLLSFTACYTDSPRVLLDFYKKHPELKKRALAVCEPFGGVYKWVFMNDEGKVICYNNKIYNLFTQQEESNS